MGSFQLEGLLYLGFDSDSIYKAKAVLKLYSVNEASRIHVENECQRHIGHSTKLPLFKRKLLGSTL